MRPPVQWVENTKLVREPPLEAREPLLPPRKAARSPKLAFILAAAGLHIGCLAASATFVRSLRTLPQDDPAVVANDDHCTRDLLRFNAAGDVAA